ncbi:MAG: hypothetical protein LBN97_04620 [Oscillospiraceae bacterium]|jgi:hypothetical protein|nr:hypothetical protein [Oscillospiraceae bacterium]
MKKRNEAFRETLKKPNKKLQWVYRILYIIVFGIIILEVLNRAWYNVFLCVLTILLWSIPQFIERRAKINIPDTLEVIVLLFIFAAEILGELREYYSTYIYWDTMLHTTNGFLCAAIGLSLINIINNSPKFTFSLSPPFVIFVAFCFSMTVGVLWEFFEFGCDLFLGTNMQKDTILADGTIDIGLIDTMTDMFVNFLGAAVFSVIGFFFVKNQDSNRWLEHFMLSKISDAEK